jgi:hypothetical protein
VTDFGTVVSLAGGYGAVLEAVQRGLTLPLDGVPRTSGAVVFYPLVRASQPAIGRSPGYAIVNRGPLLGEVRQKPLVGTVSVPAAGEQTTEEGRRSVACTSAG